ncbi:hypothetical protein [Brucella pituitosa]|uniref:hypothetical protein n=1 Tax=Brucella pituitosa TaxID=571256 RepID=UPI0013748461|nr:hypothetical protein [Brucella pituitosa]
MQDVQRAMMRLSELPSRRLPEGLSDAEKVEFRRVQVENMLAALKGVTAYALSEAVDCVMQNKLGHKFKPEPPELRGLCDEIMRPISEARAWDSHDRKIRDEMAADMKRASDSEVRDEAFRERQRKRMADFHAFMDTDKKDAEHNTFDAALSRLQALAEANGKTFDLYGLPSSPSDYFKQVGKAA